MKQFISSIKNNEWLEVGFRGIAMWLMMTAILFYLLNATFLQLLFIFIISFNCFMTNLGDDRITDEGCLYSNWVQHSILLNSEEEWDGLREGGFG